MTLSVIPKEARISKILVLKNKPLGNKIKGKESFKVNINPEVDIPYIKN